jgi:hypothetical protein
MSRSMAACLLFLALLPLPAFCIANYSLHYAYPAFPAQDWEIGNPYVIGAGPFWFYAPALSGSIDSIGLQKMEPEAKIAVASGQEKGFASAIAHMKASQRHFAAARANYTFAKQLLHDAMPDFQSKSGLDATSLLSWATDAGTLLTDGQFATSIITRRTFAVYAYLAAYPSAWRDAVRETAAGCEEVGRGINSALETTEKAYDALAFAGAGDGRYAGEARTAYLEYRNFAAQLGRMDANFGYQGSLASVKNSTDWLYFYVAAQPRAPNFGEAEIPDIANGAYAGEESALFGLSTLHAHLADALARMEEERAAAESSAEESIGDASAAVARLTDERIALVSSGLVEGAGELVAGRSAKPFSQRARALGAEVAEAKRLQKGAIALSKKKTVGNYLSDSIYYHALAGQRADAAGEDATLALQEAGEATDAARDAAADAIGMAELRLRMLRSGAKEDDLGKISMLGTAENMLAQASAGIAAGDGEAIVGNRYLKYEKAHTLAVSALQILQTGQTKEAAIAKATILRTALLKARADGLDVDEYEAVFSQYNSLLEKSEGADVGAAAEYAVDAMVGEIVLLEVEQFFGLETKYGGLLHTNDAQTAELVERGIGEYYGSAGFAIRKAAGNYRKIKAALESISTEAEKLSQNRAVSELENYAIAVFEEPAVLGELQKITHVLRFSSMRGTDSFPRTSGPFVAAATNRGDDALKFQANGIPASAVPSWQDADIASVKEKGGANWEVSMRQVVADKGYEIEFLEERRTASVLRRKTTLQGTQYAGKVERTVEFEAGGDIERLLVKEEVADSASNPLAFLDGAEVPAGLFAAGGNLEAAIALENVKKGRSSLVLQYDIASPIGVRKTSLEIVQNGNKADVSYDLALSGAKERFDSVDLHISDIMPKNARVDGFSAACLECAPGEMKASIAAVAGNVLDYSLHFAGVGPGDGRTVRVTYRLDNSSGYANALLAEAKGSADKAGIAQEDIANAEKYLAAGEGEKAVSVLLSAKRQQEGKPAYEEAVARLEKRINATKAAGLESLTFDSKDVQKALLAIGSAQEKLDAVGEKAGDGRFLDYATQVQKIEAEFADAMRTALRALSRSAPRMPQDAVRYASEGDFAAAITELRSSQEAIGMEAEEKIKAEEEIAESFDKKMLGLKDAIYNARRGLEQYASDYSQLKATGAGGIFSPLPSEIEKGLQEIEAMIGKIAKKGSKSAEDVSQLDGMSAQVAIWRDVLGSYPARLKEASLSSLRVAQAAFNEVDGRGLDSDGAVGTLWKSAEKKCNQGDYPGCTAASRKVVASATAALDGKREGGIEGTLIVIVSLAAIAGGLALLFLGRKKTQQEGLRKILRAEDSQN